MLVHFYPEKDWTKLPDFTRNCFSFRFCTCRKALWSPEMFGSHWTHDLPSWHPAVGFQISAISVISPNCVYRNVQDMYEVFTRCPTGTLVAAREPKISVEIKHFMIDHRRDQTSDYNPPMPNAHNYIQMQIRND